MLLAIAFVSFLALIVAWIAAPSSTIDVAPVRSVERADSLSPAIQA